jgi:H-type small acid-soluble spore protein
MDLKRAKEILASEDVIKVEYKGKPVWISEVRAEHNTVKIKREAASDQLIEVQASELTEVN